MHNTRAKGKPKGWLERARAQELSIGRSFHSSLPTEAAPTCTWPPTSGALSATGRCGCFAALDAAGGRRAHMSDRRNLEDGDAETAARPFNEPSCAPTGWLATTKLIADNNNCERARARLEGKAKITSAAARARDTCEHRRIIGQQLSCCWLATAIISSLRDAADRRRRRAEYFHRSPVGFGENIRRANFHHPLPRLATSEHAKHDTEARDTDVSGARPPRLTLKQVGCQPVEASPLLTRSTRQRMREKKQFAGSRLAAPAAAAAAALGGEYQLGVTFALVSFLPQ